MRKLFVFTALCLNATTFQSTGLFPMTSKPLQPLRILSADMNRDGFADLVTVYTTPGGFLNSSVSIALGSRGGFASSFNETVLQGEAIDAQIGDFTGDGFPDVLVLTGSALCLAGGNGLGSVSGISCSALSEPGSRLTTGDFNGDGFLDAAVTLPVSARVGVWFNRLDRTFGPGPTAPIASPGVIAASDLNTDGFADLIVQSRTGQLHVVISGQGPSINVAQSIPIPVSVSDIALGDFNRDRRLDIVLTDPAGSAYLTLAATGSATPYFSAPVTSTSLAAPNLLQLADFNGDGVPEIFAATSAGMLIADIAPNGGVRTPPLPGFGIASSIRFAVVDFNADGILDIATAGPHTGTAVSIFVGAPTLTSTVMDVSSGTAFYGQRTTITVRVQINTPPFPVTTLASGRIILFRNGVPLQDAPVTPVASPEMLAAGVRDVATARFDILLPAGVYDLSAGFSGSSGFGASSAPAVRISIQAVPTTIRIVTVSNEIPRDQGLRVGASVLGPLSPVIDGIVKLAVNGTVVSQGLVTNGVAQLFIQTGLPVGKIKVKLFYEGTGYQPSETNDLDFVVRTTLTAAHAATYRPVIPSDGFAALTLPGFDGKTPGRITSEFRQPGLPTIAANVTYVGDGQVNIYVPAGVQAGTRTLHVLQDGAGIASGEVTIARVAPGMFTVDGAVDGVPAAYAAIYSAGGGVRDVPVFDCSSGRCVAAPLSTGGESETLVVSLFGTGWRNAGRVTALLAGAAGEVLFAGAHPVTPGLDQLNVVIPKSLARRGEVDLILAADGNTSNRVKMLIQ
jgi:uncharacterized protein (TIGR03437 family)